MMTSFYNAQFSSRAEFALTAMSTSSHEKAITIAVSLLKTNNSQTIQTLKDLLTFIPNPNHIKNVLASAVIELVYTYPESAFWLFQNPEALQSQIDVKQLIAEELTNKLLSWGYTLNDFYFTTDYKLEVTEAIRQHFFRDEYTFTNEAVLILIRSLLVK